MTTLEEIKAATAKLRPEEQVELFKWWTNSEVFRARQLSSLKHELALGIDQPEGARHRTYQDANVI